ncbi:MULTISPECIES: hypothetical protein [unclassified Arthrobacter]|uniref:hypothetical protein n=1 Tax=unclassified Arthrobacter TaxID=235627 RepID=UPI00254F11FF|nr:hypothetical protein [Arthrobacter sp. efr-133-TYG-120]
MVNAVMGLGSDMPQRLNQIERNIRDLSTQPVLRHASTGQDGGKGLSTDVDGLHLFTPSGTEVIHLDTNTGTFFAIGQVGQVSISGGADIGSTVPLIEFATSDNGGVQSYPGMLFQSYNELIMQGPQTITNGSSNAILSAKDSGAWAKTYDTTGSGAAYLNISNTGTFYLGNWAGTAGVYTTAKNGPVLIVGGLTVSGTKNFVQDHPTKPGYILKHASVEGPVNGVEYFGTITLGGNGEAVVALPDYFEALTYAENRNVQVTAIGRASVPVSADRISAGSFTVYGAAGQEVDWMVKAVRCSTNPNEPIDFEVVSLKDTTPPTPPTDSTADTRKAPSAAAPSTSSNGPAPVGVQA